MHCMPEIRVPSALLPFAYALLDVESQSTMSDEATQKVLAAQVSSSPEASSPQTSSRSTSCTSLWSPCALVTSLRSDQYFQRAWAGGTWIARPKGISGSNVVSTASGSCPCCYAAVLGLCGGNIILSSSMYSRHGPTNNWYAYIIIWPGRSRLVSLYPLFIVEVQFSI